MLRLFRCTRFTADVSIKIRPSGWFHVKVVVTKTLGSSQLTTSYSLVSMAHWITIVINTISLSMVYCRLSTQDGCYFNRLTNLKVGSDLFPLEKLKVQCSPSLHSPRCPALPWSPPARTVWRTVSTSEWLSRASLPSADLSWRPSTKHTWTWRDLVLGIYHSKTTTSTPPCLQPLATWTAVTPCTTQWPTVQISRQTPRLSYISSGCRSRTTEVTWGSGPS